MASVSRIAALEYKLNKQDGILTEIRNDLQTVRDDIQKGIKLANNASSENFDTIEKIIRRQNNAIFMAIVTGVMAVRLATLSSHLLKTNWENPLWITSFSILVTQSLTNVIMWFVIVRNLRQGNFNGPGKEIKLVSIGLTILSLAHNAVNIADIAMNRRPFEEDNPKKSPTMDMVMQILNAFLNTGFVIVGAYSIRNSTQTESTESDTMRNFAEFAASLSTLTTVVG